MFELLGPLPHFSVVGVCHTLCGIVAIEQQQKGAVVCMLSRDDKDDFVPNNNISNVTWSIHRGLSARLSCVTKRVKSMACTTINVALKLCI